MPSSKTIRKRAANREFQKKLAAEREAADRARPVGEVKTFTTKKNQRGSRTKITNHYQQWDGKTWKNISKEEYDAKIKPKKEPISTNKPVVNESQITKPPIPPIPPSKKLPKSLRYPYEATNNTQDYIQFSVHNYQRGGLTGGPLRTESLGTITLPVPSQISDSNSANFGSGTMNTFQQQGLEGTMQLMDGDFTGAGQTLNNLIGDAVGGGLAKQFMALQAVNSIGGNITLDQLLARNTGNIINPNMELLFSGPSLRQFKFSFKFTPRFEQEGDEVRMIIKAFKKNMSPKGGGVFLRTPNIFQIKYLGNGGNDHRFLNKFKLCALTSMNVNYSADGVHATYHDETPVSMTMDLSFQELTPVYNEDYDYESKGGVGY